MAALQAAPSRGGACPREQQLEPHRRPARCCVAAAATRREALLAGGGAALGLAAARPAAAAAPPPPKPFCAVVDRPPAWAFATPWQEDVFEFAGGRTWYRAVNQAPPRRGLLGALPGADKYGTVAPGKLPLLVLPGGPGLPAGYLESVELVAGVGRTVVFYDQLGCGNTLLASGGAAPPDADLTPAALATQLDALRERLGLERVHLYGQGAGGVLALSYAARAGGVVSVTAASTPPSSAALAADRRAALAAALPPGGAAALLEADAAGALGGAGLGGGAGLSPEAAAAWAAYNRARVCRFGPATAASPPGCARGALARRSPALFRALAGGRYFDAAGALAGWDAAALLAGGGGGGLAALPVLVSRGEFDEVSPASARALAAALPGGSFAEFAGSGAFQHIDAWEPHLTAVEEHMCAAEGSPPPTAA
ncbi:pip [Scenedesmus sp. PABB004]|nr:pip [Scenedesmus sp. PABB004]